MPHSSFPAPSLALTFPPSQPASRRPAPLAGARAQRSVYLNGTEAQRDPLHAAADRSLREHVLHDAFPCVAARSAFNKGQYRFGLFDALGSESATQGLHAGLVRFCEEFETLSSDFVTFLAVFDGPHVTDEQGFESLLWQQLQALHGLDARHHPWAAGVGHDASQADFSFSVAGRAFFIVGMHPLASRMARRSPRPTLVFNFHEQFEHLRESGKFEGMKTVIRRRDLALQGSINPVLAQFGESSEARQYAGRQVPADWQCPFHARQGAGQ